MTPPSPTLAKKMTFQEMSAGKASIERDDFYRKLAKKKPLLQRQKSDPTPVDITNEESIASYIANETKMDE